LERIVKASSNRGDIVLDPFFGSGTTLVAAQKLNRHWVGIESNCDALNMTSGRLRDTFPDISFETIRLPEEVRVDSDRQSLHPATPIRKL
ncbi:DNA methyltransferase, partial [Chloroflexota bacterium]